MYGLLITLGVLISVHLAEVIAKRKKLSPNLVWKVAFTSVFFGLVGARLYHVLNEWELYFKSPLSILFIWNGGLGIVGGIMGGIVGLYFSAPKKYFLKLGDIYASVIPLGQSIGRWGNYFNGELLPYAIYESLADLLLFVLLQSRIRTMRFGSNFLQLKSTKELEEIPEGNLTLLYLVGYALIRIVLDQFHSAKWVVQDFSLLKWAGVNNFNVTQTIAILVLVLSLGALWKNRQTTQKK